MDAQLKEYRAEIAKAIRALHGCESAHQKSVPVTERFQGQVAWEGVVEVLDLIGHPQAKAVYAWGHQEPRGRWEITTVLETSPVISPETAVKAALVAKAREMRRRRT